MKRYTDSGGNIQEWSGGAATARGPRRHRCKTIDLLIGSHGVASIPLHRDRAFDPMTRHPGQRAL